MASRHSAKLAFACLAAALVGTSDGVANEYRFAGRWAEPGPGSPTIGVIQYGQRVTVISRDGWSIGTLEPGTGGRLAVGDGRWTFGTAAGPANVSIGKRNGRLYLIISPQGTDGTSDIKMIAEPVTP